MVDFEKEKKGLAVMQIFLSLFLSHAKKVGKTDCEIVTMTRICCYDEFSKPAIPSNVKQIELA